MKFELFSKWIGTVKCSAVALLMAAPLEAVALNELRADQQAEIISNEGREIAVRGTVSQVTTVGSSMISFINFEGVKFGGFSAVVKKDDVQILEKQWGGRAAELLLGREIVLRGKVAMFDGRPQIQLRDSGQIELVAKGADQVSKVGMEDSEALRKLTGTRVSIEGIVSRVASSKNGGVVFMNFEGAPPEGVTAVVMQNQVAAIEASVGGNLDAALPGRKVILTGPISLYRNSPQIELKSGDQIKVVH